MKSTLIGWHGHKNLGDDAFCAILTRWMVESFGATSISVNAHRAFLPNEIAEGVEIIGEFPAGQLSHLRRYWLEARQLWKSRLVVFGGGTIFQQRHWSLLQKQLQHLTSKNAAIAAVGVSLGPFSNVEQEKGCLKVLRFFDAIQVRDRASFEWAQANGLSQVVESPDLVFGWPAIFSSPPRTDQRSNCTVGISITDRSHDPEVDAKKRKEIAAAIRLVADEQETHVRVLNCCTDSRRGDFAASERLMAELDGIPLKSIHRLDYEQSVDAFLQGMEECHAILCNRMHAFIFSLILERPCIMMSYAKKMDDLAHDLQIAQERIFQVQRMDGNELAQVIRSCLVQDGDAGVSRDALSRACVDVQAALKKTASKILARLQS